jgi:hypothetical protein
VNDIGIVFIGLLLFPILKKQSESMALAYVALRMFEAFSMVVGALLGMALIPLSREFLKSGAENISSFQAIGAVLQQSESWFLNTMQLLFLGMGGMIMTAIQAETSPPDHLWFRFHRVHPAAAGVYYCHLRYC